MSEAKSLTNAPISVFPHSFYLVISLVFCDYPIDAGPLLSTCSHFSSQLFS